MKLDFHTNKYSIWNVNLKHLLCKIFVEYIQESISLLLILCRNVKIQINIKYVWISKYSIRFLFQQISIQFHQFFNSIFVLDSISFSIQFHIFLYQEVHFGWYYYWSNTSNDFTIFSLNKIIYKGTAYQCSIVV